ncbi:restriction endonuclease subunit S [Aerococcus urinaeequi]|uniref:restriction endonuclease subunit S n=1 Tax=Aerococcus urinaeequi TaxID=51665 RepID=UPI001C710AEB|nr:restriction endonuclease subunit S [Aerococcus urinaeequi]
MINWSINRSSISNSESPIPSLLHWFIITDNITYLYIKKTIHDWEQRKFGNFIEEYVEKTTSQNQYPVLTSSQQVGIVLQEDYFSNRQVTTSKNIGYFVLPKGYFTYRSRSDNGVFVFNRNDSIDKGIISYFYPVFRVINADSDFFLRRINFGVGHQIAIAAEGTGQHVLSLKKFKDIRAMFPVIQEQVKIGNLFSQLDIIITLHQRKLEQLEKLKQALLQQMFPQNDETVPKLRFANFNDEWEQHKLGELGKTKSGTGFPDDEQGGEKGIPFFKVSDMNNIGNEHELKNSNNYVDEEQLKKRNWKPIMNVPAIIFAKVGAAIMLNRKRIVRIPFLLDNNTMAYIFDDSWNSDFGKVLFETIYLPRYAQVGALPSYNGSDINSIKIFVPNKNEQEKIGVFFKALDNLITIHQQKLNYYKLFKQTLLQLMFV